MAETRSSFVEHVAWSASFCESTMPRKHQQDHQRYECQSSSNHEESISAQSSVEDALYPCRPLEIFQETPETQAKEIFKGLINTKEEHGAPNDASESLDDPLWFWRKQRTEEFTCWASSYTTDHEHIGSQPHSQSPQNSQGRYLYKAGIPWKKEDQEEEDERHKQSFLNSLMDNTRSGLKRTRNIFDLVSATMDLLDNTGIPLITIQVELLEWLQRIELAPDWFLEKQRRVYSQLLIYALIFFWLFNEFPNGIRHLCTTMPWTIWPSLVVLWGVCWMFHPEDVSPLEDIDNILSRLLPNPQRLSLNFQGEFCYIDDPLFSG
ncbi:hypothetical protein ACQKWADRAFT_306698 [Trichoderma austrokoningii]